MSLRRRLLALVMSVMMMVTVAGSQGAFATGFAAVGASSINDVSARYSLMIVKKTLTGKPVFDINNFTNSSDASIRQTYYADIKLKLYDADLTKEMFKNEDQIIKKPEAGKSVDLGSFAYTSDSKIDGIVSEAGYLEFVLHNLRYSGNGKKLEMRVTKDNYAGDVSTEIAECIARSDSSGGGSSGDKDDPAMDIEKPYVIVSKYGYGGGTVTAGDTFSLSLTLKNTSSQTSISNMMMTLTMPDDLMLTSSSNTFYIERLGTEESITKSVLVTAKAGAKPQSHNIAVAMKYQYVDDNVGSRKDGTTDVTIAIPVIQVDRFEVTGVDLPMEAMEGEEVCVTVNYVNKGRSEVYNLAAEIDGNIQNPGQKQNLGNLASGATGSADFYVLASEVGMMSGEIKLTYEDTNNELKESKILFSCDIKSADQFGGGMVPGGGMIPGGAIGGDIGAGGEPLPTEEKSSLPIIIVVVIAVAIPAAIIIKKKIDKKRSEQADADL